ncbi:hypothetical protein HO173_004111 [Letharia columbiana]|uniref:GST N-terminal domain-containing protein n=1 Tax=Letharia columbiana TaxID=112416 RepID=A0A8H6L6X2_9LECA|nr:uncharacterized protein HO173_004111 [Letharia columbiana]KAF6237910.1 hypothetical protein HO173_004111 [Letharia columbiana]
MPPPPDADLYGEATGPAKTLVNKHNEPQPVKLYAGWFCPFGSFQYTPWREVRKMSLVQRFWTVLEEKRIPSRYIEVNPYHKPESLLELNARGLVPPLQYDNKPLYESSVILEFLEDTYPEHGPKLLPADPYSRARVRNWIDFVTTRVIPSFRRFLQSQSDSLNKDRSDF